MKKARKKALTRRELAAALDSSSSSMDRLIGAGLKPVAVRGLAKLYDLDAAKALQAQLAKAPTKYGESLLELFRAQEDDALEKLSTHYSKYIEPRGFLRAWREYVAWVRKRMLRWPKAIEQKFVAKFTRSDTPQEALRPLLESLVAADSPLDVAAKPRAVQAQAPATTLSEAKRRLIVARGTLTREKTRTRRGKWPLAEDVREAAEDAVTRCRQAWWSGFPAQLAIDPQSGTRQAWRRAADHCLTEAVEVLSEENLRVRIPGARKR